MKKLNYYYAVILLASATFVSSCGDDDDEPSKTDLLSRTWSITKAEGKYENFPPIDVTEYFLDDDCLKDNTVTFKKDGSYATGIGTDDCSGTEEAETGTWQWKNNETVISFTVAGDTQEFKVLELTSSVLKVDIGTTQADLDQDGDDEDVTMILTLGAK